MDFYLALRLSFLHGCLRAAMKSGVNRSKLATNASQDFFLGFRSFLNNLAVLMLFLNEYDFEPSMRIVQRE